MGRYNNLIYLLLVTERSELLKLYLQTILTPVSLAAYDLIGLFIGIPRVVGYAPIAGAIVLISVGFLWLYINRLPVDWELLKKVDEKSKPALTNNRTDDTVKTQGLNVNGNVPSNEEIQMVETKPAEFSFSDTLTELYNKGNAKDLAHIAVHGVEMKIENIR